MSDTDPTTATDDTLRTPIVAVLGHVDHGKTSLLDKIRGSAVTAGESGAITQHIGATAVPLDVISEIAGDLVDPTDFDLPGLLFIDTPGHHSFSTLRSRGGALADIAILVVDVNDGFQPQTLEAIDILKRTQTPFIVAANKIDTVPGWNPNEGQPVQQTMDAQSDRVQSDLNEKLYEIIGELSDNGFSADMYWRVQNFQANIGVVPVSAETSEGIPDLLTVMMGLSQRYMKEEMEIDTSGPGVGTVLEVKDTQASGRRSTPSSTTGPSATTTPSWSAAFKGQLSLTSARCSGHARSKRYGPNRSSSRSSRSPPPTASRSPRRTSATRWPVRRSASSATATAARSSPRWRRNSPRSR